MATPVEWLNEFQVNTGSAATGIQGSPDIIGLSNGNFLVAWVEEANGAIGTPAGTDIIGKIFDAEGNVVRNSYRLNSNRNADDERDFDIAATNDGGFVMAYIDDDISAPNNTTVVWERFNSTGNAIDAAIIANENVAADFLANPQIAVNQFNNQSIVTFTDDVGADTDIRGVTVSSSGVVSAEFDAAQNSSDFDRRGDVALLTNGNFVSVYEEEDGSNTSIEARIYTSSGTLVDFTQVINNGASNPQVTTLTNGNFVVAWESAPTSGSNSTVFFRRYSPTGAVLSNPIQASSGSAGNNNEPEIVALPDGGFVVVWDNDTDNTLRARRFNANGSTTGAGSLFTVETGQVTRPNIGVTGDGRILFTTETYFGGNGEIYASIWDPRTSTITANDYQPNLRNFVNTTVVTSLPTSSTINGDSSSETLLGQDGSDTLNAGNGNDIVRGGTVMTSSLAAAASTTSKAAMVTTLSMADLASIPSMQGQETTPSSLAMVTQLIMWLAVWAQILSISVTFLVQMVQSTLT